MNDAGEMRERNEGLRGGFFLWLSSCLGRARSEQGDHGTEGGHLRQKKGFKSQWDNRSIPEHRAPGASLGGYELLVSFSGHRFRALLRSGKKESAPVRD